MFWKPFLLGVVIMVIILALTSCGVPQYEVTILVPYDYFDLYQQCKLEADEATISFVKIADALSDCESQFIRH